MQNDDGELSVFVEGASDKAEGCGRARIKSERVMKKQKAFKFRRFFL